MTLVRVAHDDFQRLQAEVDELVKVVVELESESLERKILFNHFKSRYLYSLAKLLASVEFLEVHLARAQGLDDSEAVERAEAAMRVANDNEAPVPEPEPLLADPAVKKKLSKEFHRLSKFVHPDALIGNDKISKSEKKRLAALFDRLKKAYERGDAEEMSIIEAEIGSVTTRTDESDLENRIKALKRSQAALIKRRDELTEELNQLNQSVFERLRLEEVKAKEEGRDLLGEMAAELENRVIELQAQLDQLGVTDLDISTFNQPQS